jgi:uncharacterized protein DUF3352
VALEPNVKSRRSVARPIPAAIAVVIIVSLAGCLAGCGSSHATGTAVDPAGAVPAAASIYVGATVRPGEPLNAAALAAGRALTHQADPYGRLIGLLQASASPALDYKHDVAPWLGPRAGIFLTAPGGSPEANAAQLLGLLGQRVLGSASIASPFGAHGAEGAIVLDVSSVGGARSFLDAQARRAGAHAASYRGVPYQLTPGSVALGVVDRFAVIGSESGLHSVIDTTLAGTSLAHAPGYAALLAAAPAGALADVYVNGPASLQTGAGGQPHQSALGRAGASKAEGLSGLLRLLAGTGNLNASVVPSTTSIALDVDIGPSAVSLAAGSSAPAGARVTSAGLLSSLSQGAAALSELPGESWLAIGLGNVGATLPEDVQGLRALVSLPSSLAGASPAVQSSAGISAKGLLEGILAPLSVLGEPTAQAKHDFQSWMGSAGVFASGSGLLELKGGVAITSNDPALSRVAVGKLGAKLRKAGDSVQALSIPGTEASITTQVTGLPVALDIANGRDASGATKFVIGIGEASVRDALNPTSTLAAAASRAAAVTALGEGIQPNLLVDFPTLLGLLEGVGLLEDPTISPFVPYLRSLTTLAGGGASLRGGGERLRVVVGLRSG